MLRLKVVFVNIFMVFLLFITFINKLIINKSERQEKKQEEIYLFKKIII